jgi:hypothetical protein
MSQPAGGGSGGGGGGGGGGSGGSGGSGGGGGAAGAEGERLNEARRGARERRGGGGGGAAAGATTTTTTPPPLSAEDGRTSDLSSVQELWGEVLSRAHEALTGVIRRLTLVGPADVPRALWWGRYTLNPSLPIA